MRLRARTPNARALFSTAVAGAAHSKSAAIVPTGHPSVPTLVLSSVTATASATKTFRNSRPGLRKFRARETIDAGKCVCFKTKKTAIDEVSIKNTFAPSMMRCFNILFFTSVCMKNSNTNAEFTQSQYRRNCTQSTSGAGAFAISESVSVNLNTLSIATPMFNPCCNTCFRNTYWYFFNRYRNEVNARRSALVAFVVPLPCRSEVLKRLANTRRL